jgi:hypothetical protein
MLSHGLGGQCKSIQTGLTSLGGKAVDSPADPASDHTVGLQDRRGSPRPAGLQ